MPNPPWEKVMEKLKAPPPASWDYKIKTATSWKRRAFVGYVFISETGKPCLL